MVPVPQLSDFSSTAYINGVDFGTTPAVTPTMSIDNDDFFVITMQADAGTLWQGQFTLNFGEPIAFVGFYDGIEANIVSGTLSGDASQVTFRNEFASPSNAWLYSGGRENVPAEYIKTGSDQGFGIAPGGLPATVLRAGSFNGSPVSGQTSIGLAVAALPSFTLGGPATCTWRLKLGAVAPVVIGGGNSTGRFGCDTDYSVMVDDGTCWLPDGFIWGDIAAWTDESGSSQLSYNAQANMYQFYAYPTDDGEITGSLSQGGNTWPATVFKAFWNQDGEP